MPTDKGLLKKSKVISSYEKALILLHKENYKEAQSAFQSIIEKYGEEREVASRARVFLKLCKPRIDKQGKQTELDAQGYYEQGILHHNRGEWDEALKAFKDSLEKTGKDSGRDFIYRAVASTYARLGDVGQAITYLTKAIESNEVHRFQAQHDPDFEPFISDEPFQTLLWPDRTD
jgi:tetratricopeptide (TPR) repeat protein